MLEKVPVSRLWRRLKENVRDFGGDELVLQLSSQEAPHPDRLSERVKVTKVSLSLSLCLSVSRSHCPSLSLSLSVPLSGSISLPFFLSLSLCLSVSFSLPLPASLCLSVSLSLCLSLLFSLFLPASFFLPLSILSLSLRLRGQSLVSSHEPRQSDRLKHVPLNVGQLLRNSNCLEVPQK